MFNARTKELKMVRDERTEIRLSHKEKIIIDELANELQIPKTTLLRNIALSIANNNHIKEKMKPLIKKKKLKDFEEEYSKLFEDKIPGL